MADYNDYVRCGEVFKSSILSTENPYLLKCIQCEDIFLLLEAFVSHFEESSCEPNDSSESIKEESLVDGCPSESSDDEHDEPVIRKNNIQQLNDNHVEDFDPLVLLKDEPEGHDNEKLQFEIEVHGEVEKGTDSIQQDASDDITIEYQLSYDDDEVVDCNGENENSYVASADENSSDKWDSDLDYEQKETSTTRKPPCLSSRSLVGDFMKSHDNVLALIEAYKAQTPLWNKRTKSMRHKEHRQKCLESVTEELNNKQNLDLNWKQVSTLIVHICRKYREDLKNLKDCQENKKKYRTLWFFEYMQFLQPFMENNYLAKLDSHLPNLLPEQILQICEIYEGLPHLWNTNLIEHRCKNKRSDAEMQMIKEIETKLGYNVDTNRLIKYLKNLHLYFSHAKRKRLNEKEVEATESDGYYQHISFLYDHVGPFKCSECDYESQSSFKLKVHTSQHDGSMPFKCPQCRKEFSSIHSYDVHVRRHMEDFRDVCKECGRKFINPNDLQIHMRTHTEAMPYCCEICGISFRHSQTLRNHSRRHTKHYLHTCELCSKGFYSKAKINDHMKTHTNIRDCICKTCGKAFKTMNSLKTHESIHSDVRKYVCNICGKAFKLSNGLTQHMRTHGTKLGEDKNS